MRCTDISRRYTVCSAEKSRIWFRTSACSGLRAVRSFRPRYGKRWGYTPRQGHDVRDRVCGQSPFLLLRGIYHRDFCLCFFRTRQLCMRLFVPVCIPCCSRLSYLLNGLSFVSFSLLSYHPAGNPKLLLYCSLYGLVYYWSDLHYHTKTYLVSPRSSSCRHLRQVQYHYPSDLPPFMPLPEHIWHISMPFWIFQGRVCWPLPPPKKLSPQSDREFQKHIIAVLFQGFGLQ